MDIATHSNVDRMMTSKVLRTLENKGFLTRKQDKVDTRAKSIELTESGDKILIAALEIVHTVDKYFFLRAESNKLTLTDHMLAIIKKMKL